jgi:hypothetical protein
MFGLVLTVEVCARARGDIGIVKSKAKALRAARKSDREAR